MKAPLLVGLAIAVIVTTLSALAADPPGSAVVARRTTIAGELTITRLGEGFDGPYRIALGDRLVLQTDNDKPAEGMPIPNILTSFPRVAPYDEVVVMQQNTAGNACNGGPIWFLGLLKSGDVTISTPIDFCGGADPVIDRKGARIVLTFPGGPPNRGDGRLPTEVWVFEHGMARQLP